MALALRPVKHCLGSFISSCMIWAPTLQLPNLKTAEDVAAPSFISSIIHEYNAPFGILTAVGGEVGPRDRCERRK